MKKEELRPVEVTSGGTFIRGWFHGYNDIDFGYGTGKAALVEIEDGTLKEFEIGNTYQIRFLDREIKK